MDNRKYQGLAARYGADVGSISVMDPITGTWYESLRAAFFVWGTPLDGLARRQAEQGYQRFSAALPLVSSLDVHGSFFRIVPYVAVFALSLKAGGFGRMVSEDIKQFLTPGILGLWRELQATDPFRTAAAAVIQRHWRGWRRLARLESIRRQLAARRIQQGCRNWILKPVTADGRLGINMCILLQCHSDDGLQAADRRPMTLTDAGVPSHNGAPAIRTGQRERQRKRQQS